MSHTYIKEAKASRAKKMKSYTSADPHKKVDSSDWTPAEPLNTDVKTGMRPISKRAFKRGGKVLHKVEGAHSKVRHDRIARKSGGKALTADSLVNRNVKDANQERAGKKHVGGMKSGGRAHKMDGGPMSNPMNPIMAAGNRINAMNAGANVGLGGITPGMPTGSAGKSILRSKALGFKKGGEAKHPDVAEDKKLIKKMVKPSAMKREEHCWGGKTGDKKNQGGGVFSGNSKEKIPGAVGGRKAKMGGGGFRPSELTQYEMARRPAVEAADDYLMDSANNEDKLRGATRNFERVADETGYSNRKHGGRSKHASGGKVGKGKTNINIVIAPHGGQPQQGQPAPMGGMMPPQPVPQPNRPPMPGGMPMGGGLDPNLAVAALAGRPQGQPQPQMPMGRKSGGRVAKTEHVIDHAAGGGLGRLEKIKAYGHKAK